MAKPQMRYWQARQTLWTGSRLVEEGMVFQSAHEWSADAAVVAAAPRTGGAKTARVMSAEEFFSLPSQDPSPDPSQE